jgi:hypothetical protein
MAFGRTGQAHFVILRLVRVRLWHRICLRLLRIEIDRQTRSIDRLREWFLSLCQQTIKYPRCLFCNSWSGQSGKFISTWFSTACMDFSKTTTGDVDWRNFAAKLWIVTMSSCRSLLFKFSKFRNATQLANVAQMIFAVRVHVLPDRKQKYYQIKFNWILQWYTWLNFFRKNRLIIKCS